jgi:general secretion pathway protein I
MCPDRRLRIRATAADRRQRAARGFTLLEVVVALAIAGLALVGMFEAASGGLLAAADAGRVEEAVERAQPHLATFGRVSAIVSGAQEGDDGGGYHWQLSATPLAVQPQTFDGRPTSATTLFDVKVAITWRDGGRKRAVVLDTRRISGPAGAP